MPDPMRIRAVAKDGGVTVAGYVCVLGTDRGMDAG